MWKTNGTQKKTEDWSDDLQPGPGTGYRVRFGDGTTTLGTSGRASDSLVLSLCVHLSQSARLPASFESCLGQSHSVPARVSVRSTNQLAVLLLSRSLLGRFCLAAFLCVYLCMYVCLCVSPSLPRCAAGSTQWENFTQRALIDIAATWPSDRPGSDHSNTCEPSACPKGIANSLARRFSPSLSPSHSRFVVVSSQTGLDSKRPWTGSARQAATFWDANVFAPLSMLVL